MEQNGKAVPPIFRSAVFLGYPDAIALKKLLTTHLADVEEAIAAAEAEAAQVQGDG